MRISNICYILSIIIFSFQIKSIACNTNNGIYYLKKGDYEKAVNFLSKCDLENDFAAQYAIALCYEKLLNNEKSIYYYRMAIKNNYTSIDFKHDSSLVKGLIEDDFLRNAFLENKCEIDNCSINLYFLSDAKHALSLFRSIYNNARKPDTIIVVGTKNSGLHVTLSYNIGDFEGDPYNCWNFEAARVALLNLISNSFSQFSKNTFSIIKSCNSVEHVLFWNIIYFDEWGNKKFKTHKLNKATMTRKIAKKINWNTIEKKFDDLDMYYSQKDYLFYLKLSTYIQNIFTRKWYNPQMISFLKSNGIDFE